MRFQQLYIILVMGLLLSSLSANVVINEFLYDPEGIDTGNEWLELYNNSAATIDLEGAQIQTAGSQFITIYTFPHYLLRPGRFVLIGEENITQAIFIISLAMQNGGSETDGVRFISAEGDYTDTVLYDEPNANFLPDDNGTDGISFAVDVQPGCSLARKADGFDTDNSSADFVSQSTLTPGLSNPLTDAVDYALESSALDLAGEMPVFSTFIVNNSIIVADTLTITLTINFYGVTIQSFDIQPIPIGSSIPFSTPLNLPDNPAGILQINLDCYSDYNILNNTWTYSFGNQQLLHPVINEILYNPETDNQEWVELALSGSNYTGFSLNIEDASGNDVTIDIPVPSPAYIVLCHDKDLLLSLYPDCPEECIIETSSLPSLNNDGDTLYLRDSLGVVIDSMSYTGVSDRKGYSLERQTESDSTVTWHYCYDTAKGTPGLINSFAPPPPPIEVGSIKILNSPFNPLADESLRIQYNFKDATNTISCTIFDLKGNKRHIIAESLPINQSGEITWNGRDRSGRALPRGIYILQTETKNSSGKYFLRKQLTVVLATK